MLFLWHVVAIPAMDPLQDRHTVSRNADVASVSQGDGAALSRAKIVLNVHYTPLATSSAELSRHLDAAHSS